MVGNFVLYVFDGLSELLAEFLAPPLLVCRYLLGLFKYILVLLLQLFTQRLELRLDCVCTAQLIREVVFVALRSLQGPL